MMRKMFLTLALGLTTMAAMAQSTRTIKGAVVDKNGNPLPGATVEATDGAESTTVDADGTFSLEVPRWLKTATAKYAGMKNRKLKVQDGDMIFRMTSKDDNVWFVNAIGGYAIGVEVDDSYTVGAMGGKLSKWGGYAKVMWTPSDAFANETAVPVATVGVTKRMYPFMFAYFGAGYGKVNYDDEYDETYIQNSDAAAIDLGLIFRPVRHLTVNVGTTLVTNFNHSNVIVTAGVGYAF